MTGREIAFGRYRLVERLAVGGMAELYRAVLPGPSGFSKTVAIKKIVPQINRYERFRKMFQHEGRIMAALSHRNVVQVFELGEVEGELYMCLELVEGCDLARVLRWQADLQKPIEPALAAWMALEVCRGLEYVHNLNDDQGRPMNVVHRDVNPHNILLSTHGDVKLGDFGIAKSLVREVQTLHGQVRGKLEYLAPEQAVGDTVGHQADIYAVGLVLFEMLSTQRYILGNNQMEMMNAAAKPVWRALADLNPRVSNTLEGIVRRALREEPERRYATASAMADALTQFLDGEPRLPGSQDLAVLVGHASGRKPLPPRPSPAQAADQPLLEQAPRVYPGDEPNFKTVSLAGQPVGPEPGKHRKALYLAVGVFSGLVALVLVVVFGMKDPSPGPPEPVPAKPAPEPSLDGSTAPEPKPPESTAEEAADACSKSGVDKALADGQPDGGIRPLAAKKRRRGRKRSKKKKRTELAVVQPTEGKPNRSPSTLTELRKEFKRQRVRLHQKGIRRGDLPAVDALLDRLHRNIRSGDRPTADANLLALDHALDALHIDHDFIERKMRRLQRALTRAHLEARFAVRNQKILEHAVRNRFEEANAAINRAFDELEQLKKSAR